LYFVRKTASVNTSLLVVGLRELTVEIKYLCRICTDCRNKKTASVNIQF